MPASRLIFMDTFDHYDTPGGSDFQQYLGKWTGGTAQLVAGRTGKGAGITGTSGMSKTLVGSPYTSVCAGIAYKTTSFANFIISFQDVWTGSAQFGVRHVGDGRLVVSSIFGYNGTPSAFVMHANQWYYVECKCVCNVPSGGNSSIDFTVRINGTKVIINETLVLTGRNFQQTAAQFLPEGVVGGTTIDDVYVTDGEMLGDVRGACLFRRTDGTLLQWTPLSGTSHVNMVKEHVPDDDTTYLYDPGTVLNHVDSGLLDNLPGNPTIMGAQGVWRLRNEGSGSSLVKGSYFDGAATTVETDTYPPTQDNYLYMLDPQRFSVFTASAWTAAEINAMELGIKRTA